MKAIVERTCIALVLALCLLLSTATLAEVEAIAVGDLVERVIAGKEFTGREVVLTGIALNDTSSGDRLVNIGTAATYQSRAFHNFVSIYEVGPKIVEGAVVTIRVSIETAMSYALGGTDTVMIEATFIECMNCD